MANYLVASGSRKVSQLEIATNPVPENSASAMLLVIGDAFPATNATTVQITPDNFLTNLVFDANETYTGANTFSGTNTFSGNNTFTASNNSFNDGNTYFNNTFDSVPYASIVNGGRIELYENDSNFDTLRIRVDSGNGILFEDSSFPTYYSFLEVKPSQGDIHLKRNTVISGSLTVQEVFYVYETASFMNSSGSTTFGDTIDDEHQFTGSIYLSGSIAIIDGGLVDGVDLDIFSSSVQAESASFALRVTQDEADLALLSASYENFSGSQYQFDSASFSFDITENSQSLSLLSASFEATSSQIFDDIDYLSGSFEATSSQVFDDIDYLSGSYENFSGSQYQTDSGSFTLRITNNELTGSDHEDRIIKGTNAVTSSAVSSSYIDLDVLANGDVPAHKAGRIFFGSEDGALEVYNEEADITLQVGQEFWIRAFNKSGGVISNGTPVYASGSQGDRIGIYPATAEDHTSGVHYDNHILGIATHQIGINEEGYVTAQGIVRGIDTQNFTAGDILYLQTGSPATVEDYYRNTPPPFPYDIVQVGYVARSAANGFVFAEPKEPVHFNNISGLSGSATLTPGDLWVYQPNNGWSTTHNLTGSYTLDGNIVGGQFTGSFSGSLEGDGTNITGVTAADVDFDNISNKPTLISQSQQVDADNVTNFDSNVLTYIDSLGVFSGSSQVDADSVTNFDSNVLTYNNSLGVVSGSSQVVFNDTSFNPFISTSAAISASNHFVPSDNEVYDLGTPTQRWRDLYLSGSTIDLGGLLIQRNVDGNVQFIDSASQATKTVEGIGSAIFLQTGSYYSTANDLQITGSIVVSNDITASKLLLDEGSDNIFVGLRVGTQLDTVSSADNVAIGTDALGGQSAVGSQNVDSNVAIGYNALYAVQTGGSSNVGIGYRALFDNTSGNNNTAIGPFAGSNINIGDRNTTIGSNSGLDITSGNGNTTVGYLADVQSGTDFNSIVIGSGSVGNGSNTVVIGNDNITSTELKGNVTASGAISASGELIAPHLDLRTYDGSSGDNTSTNYSDEFTYSNSFTGSSGYEVIPRFHLIPNSVYLFTIGNTSLFENDPSYFRASTTIFTGPRSGSVTGPFVEIPTAIGNPGSTTVSVASYEGCGVKVKLNNAPSYDGTPTTTIKVTATLLSQIDM